MQYISPEPIENLRLQLNGIAESLLDISSVILSAAVEANESKPPQVDKLVNQSLRAVNKAIGCLEKAEAQCSSGETS